VSVSGGTATITGTSGNPLIRLGRGIANSEAVHFTFAVSGTSPNGGTMLEAGSWGQSSYRRWEVYASGGSLRYRFYKGATAQSDALLTLAAGSWYEAELRIGADGALSAAVWERDNPTVRAGRVLGLTAGDWDGSGERVFRFAAYAGANGVLALESVEARAVGESGQRTQMVDESGNTQWSHDRSGGRNLYCCSRCCWDQSNSWGRSRLRNCFWWNLRSSNWCCPCR